MGTPQAGGAAPSGGDMLMQFVPLILMFAIFWFLLIRPQQKRAKAHKQMLAELKRGDQQRPDRPHHGDQRRRSGHRMW